MKRTLALLGMGLLIGSQGVWAQDATKAAVPAKTTVTAALQDKSLKDPRANPKSNPDLPNVLILGDSISLGYTVPVRQILLGKANVFRPSENCTHSGYALERTVGGEPVHLAQWLGTNHWDVIHFNFGIWDTHGFDKATGQWVQNESKAAPDDLRCRTSLGQYRTNLTTIVKMLKDTGARLIWASTTPVMTRKGSRLDAIPRYNEMAAAVMKENGVEVDDLCSLALSHAAEWQQGDGCHYNPTGCSKLGEQVSKSVLAALAKGRPK